MTVFSTAMALGRWMVYVGLACGVLYSVGGFFVDLFTTGLDGGTAMAFGGLVGMPAIFGAAGFVAGAVGALLVGGILALRGSNGALDDPP